MHFCFRCFSLVYLLRIGSDKICSRRQVSEHVMHELWPTVGSLVMRYSYFVTTQHWMHSAKSEFRLVGYIYSVTRAQQANLKCMLGVARPHMPPGASREGCRKSAVMFCDTKYIKILWALCWGRNGHGRTNYVRRTMHILDVINSVSRSSKYNKIVGGLGFGPDPTGEMTVLLRPPTRFKGAYFKAPISKGSRREGSQNGLCSQAPETLAPPLLVRGRAGARKHWFAGAQNLKLRHCQYKWPLGFLPISQKP